MYQSQFIEMFGGDKVEHDELSSVCSTFIDGDWIESKDQSESGIRLIQTGNVGCGEYKDKGDKAKYITEDTFNRLHCTEIFPGDILISRLPDPVGRACILPEGLGKCITAVDCTIIRLSDKMLPKFFVAFTNSPDYLAQIKSTLAGTTRLRVSRGNLGKVKIPIPTIDQQRAFVTIAEQADKSKFVDFKSQFIEMFSGHSDTVKLKDIVTVMDDKRKPINEGERSSMKEGTMYPYYGATGVVDYINDYLTDERLLCIAEDCGNYGPGEESSYIIEGRAWVNNHAHVVKPNEEKCDITYLHNYLKVTDLSPFVSGTTRKKLTQKAMNDLSIVLPPIEEQKVYVQICNQADKSKFELKKSIEQIERVIKALMQ